MAFDPDVLGDNITRYRERAGLSQQQLGLRCGVTQVAIHFWEKGRTTPNLIRLALIAEVLNTTVGELLGETIDTNGDPDKAVA
jgi:transcriptional regulator with XRE-family HTH domain